MAPMTTMPKTSAAHVKSQAETALSSANGSLVLASAAAALALASADELVDDEFQRTPCTRRCFIVEAKHDAAVDVDSEDDVNSVCGRHNVFATISEDDDEDEL